MLSIDPSMPWQTRVVNSTEYLAWFAENIDFFESIVEEELLLPVPSCPGWSMLDLLNHLSFGVGICYPIAAETPPDTPTELVFENVDQFSAQEGGEAIGQFRVNIRNCITALDSMSPESRCCLHVPESERPNRNCASNQPIQPLLDRLDLAKRRPSSSGLLSRCSLPFGVVNPSKPFELRVRKLQLATAPLSTSRSAGRTSPRVVELVF